MATKECSLCHTVTDADAHFCGVCGAPLTATALSKAVTVERVSDRPRPSPQATGGRSGPWGQPAAPRLPSPSAHAPRPQGPSVAPRPPAAPLTPSPLPQPRPAGSPARPAPVTAVAAPPRGRPRSLDHLVGRTLNGRYQVQRKIGEGGFGAVFEGRQAGTGRAVALKLLHPHSVADPTVVARFRREAEACSQLRSSHTVTIYDFDQTEDGVLYLAMELVRGESLQEIQRAGGVIAPERALRILDQVAEALGEAHDQGIVHRDMKPENIMVECRGDEDFVKVLDFGIAKIVSGEGGKGAPALTAIGQTVGTLEFMSPEQLRGKPLDGRSDIYALGMVAYEMLTGQLPFKDAKSTTDVIQFHLQETAPAPSSLRPDLGIAPAVDSVVLKMVAKLRDARHAHAAELRQHISEALAALAAKPAAPKAIRIAVIAAGLAVLVGIVAGAVALFAR